jgi:hypothetical protein
MNKNLLNEVVERARKNLEEHGELIPVFFVGGERGLRIVGATFTSDEEKDKTADVVRSFCREENADFVMFVAESWSVGADKADEFKKGLEEGKWKNVAGCPFRTEIVSFMVETKASDKMGYAEIKTVNGKKTFGEVEFTESQSSGRFTHFLGPKAVKH